MAAHDALPRRPNRAAIHGHHARRGPARLLRACRRLCGVKWGVRGDGEGEGEEERAGRSAQKKMQRPRGTVPGRHGLPSSLDRPHTVLPILAAFPAALPHSLPFALLRPVVAAQLRHGVHLQGPQAGPCPGEGHRPQAPRFHQAVARVRPPSPPYPPLPPPLPPLYPVLSDERR